MEETNVKQKEIESRSMEETKKPSIEETESRSMEETKGPPPDSRSRLDTRKRGRTSDLSPTEPRRSSDRRNETVSRSRAEKRVRIQDSDLSPSEPRRSSDRRNETESRFRAEKRKREDEDAYRQEQRPRAIGSISSSDKSKETGLCRYGRNCRFNHPKVRPSPWRRWYDWRHETESRSWEMQRRSHETESRFLQHKNRDTTLDWGSNESEWRFDERRSLGDVEMQRRSYETESRFLQHKYRDTTLDRRVNESDWRFDQRSEYPVQLRPAERDFPYYQSNGLCKHFLRGNCEYGSACKFLHSRDRDRDGADPMSFDVRGLPMRQDTSSDRRANESRASEERRHETVLLDPRERFEDVRQRRDKPEWMLDLEKRYNRDFSQITDEIVAGYKRRKMEEQREREIVKQRREEHLITEQIKPTVHFDEAIGVREVLPELGITRKEGDGF